MEGDCLLSEVKHSDLTHSRRKMQTFKIVVWEVKYFLPRCAGSMVWPSLLLEDRANSSRASNGRWSPPSFQNPGVVNGALESHTCMGPECRADPHCKQTGSNEWHLNIFAATRSRKGAERPFAGMERKDWRWKEIVLLALHCQIKL